jgi:membrane complex biogenesis BtpA family protein
MNNILNYAITKKVIYQEEPRQGQPENLLTPFGLASVVGIQALPGTTLNTLPFKKILKTAVDEAQMLYKAGIRNILIQNVNDLPMYVQVGTNIVSYMTVIGYAIREALPSDCILGVSVLRDDADAMVSIASAIEADYIRPKAYVGAVVGVDGVHSGCVDRVLEMRYKLKCDVQIWPDIHDRSSSPLGNVGLLDACQQAVSQGLADALIIAGKDFTESAEKIGMVKENLPGKYVFLGGGANVNNLAQVYELADGIFVASCLKDSGNMTGNLDQGKLDHFMKTYSNIVYKKTKK